MALIERESWQEHALLERRCLADARAFDALLTQEEASRLRSYTRSVHTPINRALRGFGNGSDSYTAKLWTPILDAALAKAEPLAEPVTLYRGFHSQRFFWRLHRRGSSFSDPGYCSASASASAVQRFASENHLFPERPQERYRIYLKINVPAGACVSPLGAIADCAHECEWLLPRGSQFTVQRVERSFRRGCELQLEVALRA